MTAIFVVRHPQTTWNLAERYQGRLEAPLSEEGRTQAEAVARAFAGRHLDAIYSSPLGRAGALAKHIADATGAPIRTDERLTEIAMGPWEGLYRSQIQEQYPDLYHRWYASPAEVRFPSGESIADVASRVSALTADLFACHADGYLAVVTHSVVVQTMVMLSLRLSFDQIHRIRVSNGGITTLCGAEPPGSLLSLNVTDHLHGSPVAAAMAQNCVSWRERRMTV